MAGIYIHIPFCKTRCGYCDFFTKTDASSKNLYVKALGKEMRLRSEYIDNEVVNTIYFGGGTPSQLSEDELAFILKSIGDNFTVAQDAEITLEANPDDLHKDYLESLLRLGFNRISIGIQSFDDIQLRFLNRRHSARKAAEAVETARLCGFGNISIDLMYGLPGSGLPDWHYTLDKAIALNVQHISAYHLIYEEGTPMHRKLMKGEIETVDEELSLEMFSTMIGKLTDAGYIHYEISNFGKENYFSRHNTSYWSDVKYLGTGSAAHSYNKQSRSRNIASVSLYIKGIESGLPHTETEASDLRTRYNDFVLTAMRTMWGVDASKLEKQFGAEMLRYFLKNIQRHILSGNVIASDENFKLSRNGIFISDSIMSDLMYID